MKGQLRIYKNLKNVFKKESHRFISWFNEYAGNENRQLNTFNMFYINKNNKFACKNPEMQDAKNTVQPQNILAYILLYKAIKEQSQFFVDTSWIEN